MPHSLIQVQLVTRTPDNKGQGVFLKLGLRGEIDVIHKWLPIHYSIALVQISLPSLIVMS